MPRGDGTGPWGAGPMTGRGLGYCAGFNAPGFVFGGRRGGRFWRRGFGGGGFGWRHRFFATGIPGWAWFSRPPFPPFAPGYTRDDEITFLREEAEYLNEQLNAINARLAELEKKQDEK